ncbi:MAG: SAM-dependent methyltransferase [Deltaproteobacteria bacterium]|nr:SAM-dependent methyltransferase [Deltaproteobacteria bacterium]
MVELNTTDHYYTGESPSLLWEMTISQSLGDGSGAFAQALEQPAAYGRRLGEFLLHETDLPVSGGEIIEVGGGYGTLMAGLLQVLSPRRITMIDISSLLLERQREALAPVAAGSEISFIREDVFTWLARERPAADLMILNENLGDFPTLTGIDKQALTACQAPASAPGEIPPPGELSPAQLAAEAARVIDLLELLAASGVSHIFLCEHGSDTMLPWPFSLFPAIQPPGNHINPRRINLKDHAEYNIRFDHLEQAASRLGFTVRRAHLMEMLRLRFDDEIDYLLRKGKPENEAQEILLELYEHISEYQIMLLTRA